MSTPIVQPLANVTAIKKFFELDGGRKVSMDEMKALSADERAELGKLCAEELQRRGL